VPFRLSVALLLFLTGFLVARSAGAEMISLDTDFGPVVLEVAPSGQVSGHYPSYDGELFGHADPGGTLVMTWLQPTSERECAEVRGDTAYWGTVQWTLRGDRLTGQWAYCNDPAGSGGAWNGTVASRSAEALARPGQPVTEAAMREAIRREWGDFAASAPVNTVLTMDIDCDGEQDRVVSRIDLDGPSFQVLAMTDHGGLLQSILA